MDPSMAVPCLSSETLSKCMEAWIPVIRAFALVIVGIVAFVWVLLFQQGQVLYAPSGAGTRAAQRLLVCPHGAVWPTFRGSMIGMCTSAESAGRTLAAILRARCGRIHSGCRITIVWTIVGGGFRPTSMPVQIYAIACIRLRGDFLSAIAQLRPHVMATF